MKNNLQSLEPDPVRRARIHLSFQEQANAIRAARAAELESIENQIIDERDIDAVELRAADMARVSALLSAAERRQATSQEVVNTLGGEIMALASALAVAAREIETTCYEKTRALADRQLRPFFDDQNRPAAVQLSAVVMAERTFAASLGEAPFVRIESRQGGTETLMDAGGSLHTVTVPNSVKIHSLASVLALYDFRLRALDAWRAHAADIDRKARAA
jgi:hypothetical protein